MNLRLLSRCLTFSFASLQSDIDNGSSPDDATELSANEPATELIVGWLRRTNIGLAVEEVTTGELSPFSPSHFWGGL